MMFWRDKKKIPVLTFKERFDKIEKELSDLYSLVRRFKEESVPCNGWIAGSMNEEVPENLSENKKRLVRVNDLVRAVRFEFSDLKNNIKVIK